MSRRPLLALTILFSAAAACGDDVVAKAVAATLGIDDIAAGVSPLDGRRRDRDGDRNR